MFNCRILFLLFLVCINGYADDSSNEQSLNLIKESKQFKKVGQAKFSVLFWDIYESELYSLSGKYMGHGSQTYSKSHSISDTHTHTQLSDTQVNTDDGAISQQPLLLFEIKYLKDISKTDLIERTVQQWEHLNYSKEVYSDYIPQLTLLWPDIVAGDTLTLLTEQQITSFYFNGQFIGKIADPYFGHLFLDIWLSEKTSQPKLRKQLIGALK